MKFKSCLLSIIILSVLLTSVQAGLWKKEKYISIEETDTVTSDLYLTAKRADVDGTVKGDIIVGCQLFTLRGQALENLYGAAQVIDITGDVYGDLWAFAQNVTIKGKCGSTVRTAGETVFINSEITGDALAAGREIVIGPKAIINGSLYAACESLVIDGMINGMVKAWAQEIEIGGKIQHSSEVYTEKLKFREGALIGYNLIIHSEKPLEGDFQPYVMGSVKYKKCVHEEKEFPGFLFNIWCFLAALVFAFISIALFKSHYRNNFDHFYEKPWMTLLVGFLGLIVIPAAAVITIALILTIPIGLVLIGAFLLMLYIGWVMACVLWGSLIMKLLGSNEPSLFLSALIGIILVSILNLIPVIGCLASFVTVIAGMGVLLYGLNNLLFEKV